MSGIEKVVLIMDESSGIREATSLERTSLPFGVLPCGGPLEIHGLMNETLIVAKQP